MQWLVSCCLLLLALVPLARAQDGARTGAQRVDAVTAELVADRAAAPAGGRILLGLRLAHDTAWHTYWRNSGDSGLPTTVEPRGPAGSVFGPLRWPAPMRLWVGPLANYGYEGEVVLPFEVQLPSELPASPVRFEVFAQWLVCKDVCIPGEARLALELPRAAAGEAPARSAQAALFDAMALRIPDPNRAARASLHSRDRGGVSLVLAEQGLPFGQQSASAEFFPYSAGVIAPPAVQKWLRTAQGWRMDLDLVDGVVVPDRLQGLLWVDGKPLEVHARRDASPAPEGTLVFATAGPAAGNAAAEASKEPRAGGLLQQGRATGSVAAGAAAPMSPGVSADNATGALLVSLALGLLGGVLLNLMPCVFPVIGLKVLGFAQSSADDVAGRRAMRKGGLAFAGGVLVCFWLLGGLMLALRAAGDAIGWGFQLQSAGFVAALALLFVLIGLNFSGVFEIGLGLTRLAGVGSGSVGTAPPGWLSSFGSGVLAAVVATPCTAPFMGSALGLTLTQPAWEALSVFTAIGLGMALPYALLGLFPGWIKALPRPGRWMQTLRQLLAFPMYASAAWLAWVLVQQAGPDALLRLLLAAVAVGAGAWAWGRFSVPPRARPALAWTAVAVCVAGIVALLEPLTRDEASGSLMGAAAASRDTGLTADPAAWATWSPERVSAALAAGKPVFVDFTAAWCVTCQANKRLVLDRDVVSAAFERAGVVRLRADWTRRDPQIAAELARHGRNGVPLYLLMRPGSSPVLLSEILTVPAVLQALER